MDEKVSILIADDDANARRELELILGEKGYQVEVAGTGRESLETARELFFHLAIIADQLPDKLGADLIAPLQEMSPETVVIVIAASASAETEVRALNAGATASIAKPWHKDLVLAVTGRALEKQRLIVEHRQLRAEVGKELAQRERGIKALRESEERLRNTLNNVLEGCQIIGFDWRYLYVNDAVALQGKQTKEALLGRTMMEMYPGIEQTALFTVLRRCMEERVTAQMETAFEFPDGTRGWFELRIHPVPEGIFILSFDISERMRVEARLRKLSRAVENSSSAVLIYDVGGIIDYVNPKFTRMTGYAPEEACGTHTSSLGDNSPEEDKQIWDIIAAGGEWRGEIRNRKKSGEPYWVSSSISPIRDSRGGITHFVENQEDITVGKRAEATLRESEERYRLLFENAPVGIGVADNSGNLISFNDAMLSSGGYNREEMLGKNVAELYFDPEERNRVLALAARQGFIQQYDVRFKRKDGNPYDTLLNLAPITLKGAPAWQAIVVDITERKRAEAELRRSNRALRVLSECNQTVVKATDEAGLLHDICRHIVEVGGYRLAWVGYAEVGEEQRIRPVAQAGFDEGYLETLNLTWADTVQGRGPAGTAIRTAEPAIARNIPTEPDYAPWRDAAIKRGHVSSIALPLILERRPWGALNIYATEPDAFDAEEVKLLTELTGDLAFGIMTLRTRAEHKQAELEIQQKADDITLINSLNEAINQGISFQESIQQFARDTAKVFHSYGATIYLLTEDRKSMVMQNLLLPLNSSKGIEKLIGGQIPKATIPLSGESIYRRVMEAGRTQLIDEPCTIQSFIAAFTQNASVRKVTPKVFELLGIRSVLLVPLTAEGEIVGLMEISSERVFTKSEQERLESIAGQLTVLIKRKQSEETLRQRNRELTLLNRVIASAASALKPEMVLKTTCHELARAFDIPQAGAALLDETGATLRVVAEYLAEDGPTFVGAEIPVASNPATQFVLEQKAPLAIADAQHDPRLAPVHDLMRRHGVVSMLLLPLIVDSRVVGTIRLDANVLHEFTGEEIALATSAVAAAAQVLEKAQLVAAQQRDARRLADILELGTDLATLREESLLLNMLVTRTAAFTDSPTCTVFLIDEVTGEAILAAQTGLSEGTPPDLRVSLTLPIISHSLETGEPIIIPDIDRDAPEIRSILVCPEVRAFFAYPMVKDGQTVGFMTLSSLTPSKPSAAEITAYRLLTGRAAAALENARLNETERQRSAELARSNAFIATLSQAAARLQSSLDLGQVMEGLGAKLKPLGLSFALSWFDEADGSLVVQYTSVESKAVALAEKLTGLKPDGYRIPARRVAVYANIVERRQAVFTSDAESVLRETLPPALRPLAGRLGRTIGMTSDISAMWLPLVVEERLLGVLGLWGPTLHEGDLPTASVFAGQLGAAMENARLFAEVHQQAEELEAMVEVSSALRTAQTQADMMPIVLDKVSTLLNAEGTALAMRDSANGEAVIELARGAWRDVTGLHISLDPKISGQVFDSGQPVLYADTSPSDQQSLQTRPPGGISVAACVPLIAQETAIGAMWVGRGEGIGQREIRLLTAIADIAANAIQRARLYEQTLRHAAELEGHVAERTTALSIANAELARASRAKDEFLANMSHELRTPLSNILFRVEMLQGGYYGPLTDKQVRSVEVIEESGRHLLQLINDILDVSKIEAGRLELEILPIPVESLCHSSLVLVKEIAHKKRIEIHTDVRPTVVQADGRLLKQILVNLLANAVKFTPEGGQVGLEVFVDPEAEQIHFVVWDTGVGIAEEDMDRLFEPFVQLDGGLQRRYEGTGLGLALVLRLTKLHGGSVTVRSEVGQGSRFTVSLPWHGSGQAPGGRRQRMTETLELAPVSRVQAATILLAEDNEVLSSGLQEFLSLMGYRVVLARDGGEAIEQTREEKPDLILMDIQLPGMDGLEAIRRIRTDTDSGAVPIVALTALAMPGDRDRCIEAGASEYLSKPVALEQLAEMMETLLDAARSQETLS